MVTDSRITVKRIDYLQGLRALYRDRYAMWQRNTANSQSIHRHLTAMRIAYETETGRCLHHDAWVLRQL